MAYKITPEDIYAATEGGKAVILFLYPQSAAGFSGRRNFSIRGHDDRKPSCTVFQKGGIWFLQDKGGDDNKAYSAISLVQREQGLNFPQALEWIADKFAPDLLIDRQNFGSVPGSAQPDISPVAAQEEMTVSLREGGRFTSKELEQLGYQITQEICDEFSLKPVDSYITKANAKGKSFRISSNDSYPIYYYDYGEYGKLYCPLGDLRFMWVGKKPENLISGENDFLKMYAKADGSTGDNPFIVPRDPDDEESEERDMQWKELVICSGPSDALNVRRAGYHVCWLNSETADLTPHEYATLSKIAKKIYILYDNDDTGKTQMYKIALTYLDISIIQLPADLKNFRTRKGKPCKDAKDFFVHYRKPELGGIDQIFDNLVKLSGGLKFWQDKYDKKRNFIGYDINNTQMYGFLQALGFHTIAQTGRANTFCHIRDNVVELIDKADIKARCMHEMQEYLLQHPRYYRQQLANSLFRSQQVSAESLSNIKTVTPNFNAYTKDADYFFFRNCIVRVTKDGISKLKMSDCPYYIYADKVIDHDFRPEDPFFSVRRSQQYSDALALLARCTPRTPEYASQRKKVDAMKDISRYELEILRPDFDWLQFVYNTGRTWWELEEKGYPLSEEQTAEHDLNFISKAAMLGYMLSKHKDEAKAYCVYAMETEMTEEGEHKGGTGKSIVMNSVERMRPNGQNYIDGRQVKNDKMDFILSGVRKGYTDTVYIDDLNKKVDLSLFFNWVTGKMEVNAKYMDKVTLDFADAPKVSLSSNHPIPNLDVSLRRRVWFAAFSNYYHGEDPAAGLGHWSPKEDFGRTLLQDYSEEDMNHFYNFMLNCVMVWKQFNVKIQPAMHSIERRNLKRAMTQEFLYWAEDYFTEDKLNCLIETSDVFEVYKGTLPKIMGENIKAQSFKRKLRLFCEYKEWTFNPKELLLTKTEKERDDIRRKIKGVDHYYFYIDTTNSEKLDARVILGTVGDEEGSGDVTDRPLF